MLRIITLICAIFLTLTIAFPVVDARAETHVVRDHGSAVRRMIKKRAARLAPADNAQAAPPPPGNRVIPNTIPVLPNTDAQTGTATDPFSIPTSIATGFPTDSPFTRTDSVGNGGLIVTIGNPSLSANRTIATSSLPSSTSTSTISTTSATPSSTTSSSSPTDTPTSTAQSSVVEVTITSSAEPSATSAASNSGGVTKLQRNTIIILIAIGGSIGVVGILWTIIRKWKFRPSRSLDDRMQPIDWQPTPGPHDRDITEKLNRNASVRSHGSFTSGNNHDNIADIPSHDFTAGPSHLAPGGGYLDLHRGPSPQPDLQRAVSFRTPNPYDMPNPHGPYYGAETGAYHGGYDHDRGY